MKQFFDSYNVRYTFLDARGGQSLNWVFVPGGPGADATYFISLIKELDISGNLWLMDLPGNGSHAVQHDHFDNWLEIFEPSLRGFDNLILVGHSFGGQPPLFFPELENMLKGLVILNSAPSFWVEEAARVAAERSLPDVTAPLAALAQNPTPENFSKALDACMPYYFKKEEHRQIGRKIIDVPFAFGPAAWWQQRAADVFSTKDLWIPQSVPTLIVGGEWDAMCPFTLFERDARFNRPNIQKHLIKNAGHAPWVEKPIEMERLFSEFEKRLYQAF